MRLSRLVVLPVLAVAVLAGCGSDDSSTDAPTTDAPSTGDTAAPSSDDTVAPDAGGADDTTAPSAGGSAVLASGEAPAERTITITAEGFSPATLAIGAGENVTFVSGDGGIYGVIVGDLDGATVTGGLIETFEFPSAGTYAVVEDISGATATITVGS